MKKLLCMLASTGLAAGAFAANATPATPSETHARVKLPQAREIALKACPGKIVKEELEKEKGGSGLRYSFDIANGNATHEVGIDAVTGQLLENSVEGKDSD